MDSRKRDVPLSNKREVLQLIERNGEMNRTARFDKAGDYRYYLDRVWEPGWDYACWIMLNPSKADDMQDDPTIRRCINFTKAIPKKGGLVVVNLFGLRSTDPTNLILEDDPIGPDNREYILGAIANHRPIIAAWGAIKKPLRFKAWKTLMLLKRTPLWCLGRTKDGYPRHPLYVPGKKKLEKFSLSS